MFRILAVVPKGAPWASVASDGGRGATNLRQPERGGPRTTRNDFLSQGLPAHAPTREPVLPRSQFRYDEVRSSTTSRCEAVRCHCEFRSTLGGVVSLDRKVGLAARPSVVVTCGPLRLCHQSSTQHRRVKSHTKSQPKQRGETERRETCQQAETLASRPPIRQTVRVNAFN